MIRIISLCTFLLFSTVDFAQKDSFDLVTCTPPDGWVKDLSDTSIQYTHVNINKDSWCRILITKSKISTGSSEEDFKSSWQNMIAERYRMSGALSLEDVREAGGWEISTGASKYYIHSDEAMVILTTITGFGYYFNIVITTNDPGAMIRIDELLHSVDFIKPEV